MNIDIGSFHYHKLWEKPTLEILTNGSFSNDFSINWGRDFLGEKMYTIDVVFENEENVESKIAQTVELFSNRLNSAGLGESTVWAEKVDTKYIIYAQVPEGVATSYEFESTVLQKGKFAIWGQKDEEDIPVRRIMKTACAIMYRDWPGSRRRSGKGFS
jgi:hypothetical protein